MVAREEISLEMVEKAVEIYLRHAYGEGQGRRRSREGEREGKDPFECFINETPVREPEEIHEPLHRYTMRLGNRSYPFMKLVLEEHIVRGEYFFSVDTHDHLDVRPDFPDYEDWMKLKRFNLSLKQEIEKDFQRNGLPTLAAVRARIEQCLPDRLPDRTRDLILVVDDEEDEAVTLVRLLEARGYAVKRAADGVEALEAIRRDRPSLVILDYEMPEMDGLTVIAKMREDPATREIPILLTTASRVLAREESQADEFLPKPFESTHLLDLVEKLLHGAA